MEPTTISPMMAKTQTEKTKTLMVVLICLRFVIKSLKPKTNRANNGMPITKKKSKDVTHKGIKFISINVKYSEKPICFQKEMFPKETIPAIKLNNSDSEISR